MKVLLLILIVFVSIAKTYCQNAEAPALSKDYYLQKSKTQKTVAWVLAGSGTGMMITGAIINGSQNMGNMVGAFIGETPTNENKGLWLCYVGSAAAITSIPLFISSHKNKKRAASVALSNQNIYAPFQNNFVVKTQPTLTLKLNL
jgi:hypothetical protein